MLSFSSQPRFLCPPCEGGHGNLFVQNGPLFVVCLLGFWVGFFSNTAGPWGGKSKEEWPWLSKMLSWLRFQCWTLPCFLFVLKMLFGGPAGFPISAADLFRALLLFPLFFWRPGRNFVILSRLNGHLVFPGSGGTSPPWFLRDRWHPLDTDLNPQHRHLSVPYVTWEI